MTVLLPGCAALDFLKGDDKKNTDQYNDLTEEQLHTQAKEAMDSGNYKKAIEMYENLESRFPFGDYAAQAQLNIAYSYYKNGDPEAAIASAERFIKVNPRSPSVDYAYYLKGLVNYNRDIGFMDRFLPTDSSQRDPSSAREAYSNFAELINRFPGSKYVADAQQRMVALRNNMAMHEIHIARYYMKHQAYVAAVGRASKVVEKYQRTPAVPFALEIMKEAYTQLGLNDLASTTARIYELNYPDGPPVSDKRTDTMAAEVWDVIGLEE